MPPQRQGLDSRRGWHLCSNYKSNRGLIQSHASDFTRQCLHPSPGKEKERTQSSGLEVGRPGERAEKNNWNPSYTAGFDEFQESEVFCQEQKSQMALSESSLGTAISVRNSYWLCDITT